MRLTEILYIHMEYQALGCDTARGIEWISHAYVDLTWFPPFKIEIFSCL